MVQESISPVFCGPYPIFTKARFGRKLKISSINYMYNLESLLFSNYFLIHNILVTIVK